LSVHFIIANCPFSRNLSFRTGRDYFRAALRHLSYIGRFIIFS
jgi:hypothetical protein